LISGGAAVFVRHMGWSTENIDQVVSGPVDQTFDAALE